MCTQTTVEMRTVKNNQTGAGEMAQCAVFALQACGPEFITHFKNLGVVVCACNPKAAEAESREDP